MKILSLCLIGILLAHKGITQTTNLNQGGTAQKNYYQEIPYELLNDKIIVTVEINGKPRKFLFDTGAPLQLDKALVAELNLQSTSRIKFLDAYHNKGQSDVVIIQSLKFGSLEFDSIPALAFMPDFLKCWSVEGVIGSNLLRNSIVQFNSTEKKIIFTDDDRRLLIKRDSGFPMRVDVNPESSPFIVVKLGGQVSEQLLFDTGEGGFYIMSNEAMDSMRHLHAFEILSAGYGSNSFGEAGSEKQADKYRMRVSSLRVNDAVFTNVITESARNSSNNGSRIGSKILGYGKVTLDYIHTKFYFEPFKDSVDLNEKKWPLSPTIANGQLLVGTLWGEFKNQASPGEQILAIDSARYETIDPCAILTASQLVAGEKAVVTLKDKKGKVRQLSIVKE